MATPCYIGLEHQDGYIESIYCHFDGYLSSVGLELYTNYNSLEKLEELLSNGDMSFLGKTIEDCSFYKHNGESDTNSQQHLCIQSWLLGKKYVDYLYLFKDNKWYVGNRTNSFTELSNALGCLIED